MAVPGTLRRGFLSVRTFSVQGTPFAMTQRVETHLVKQKMVCTCNIRHPSPLRKFSTEVSGDADTPFYDIVIVGGGMAGGSLALALGNEAVLADQKILLLDQAQKPTLLTAENLSSQYSNRVCALNPQSKSLLSDIGAWSSIAKLRCKPFHRMQVWDACSDSMITFNHPDLVQEIAYIVENDVTVSAITEQLDKLQNVEVKYKTGLLSLKVPTQGKLDQSPWVTLTLQDKSKVTTRLLVGADGANSKIRKYAGFGVTRWTYDQSAVVATLHLDEETENHVAWQRFLPTGPIAMLPLSSSQSSLVWSTSHEEAKKLLAMPDDEFVEAVNHAFWDDSHHVASLDVVNQIFGDFLKVLQPDDSSSVRQLPPSVSGIQTGSRAKFPLGLGHAMHYVKPRIALVGDAAHRVHPLAGQGINLGFGDVVCLKEILVQSALRGEDLGSLGSLTEYETQRQRHVVPVMMVIDALKRLYSTTNPAAVLARSLGLQATNALKPLKEAIVGSASK